MIIVKPFHCHGNLKAHASKSYLQRALVIAMLADGESTLINCGTSADADAVKHAVKALGAKVSGNETLTILPASRNIAHEVTISAGESGLALRMLAPVVSLFSRNVTIHGEGSLVKRPLKPLLEVLSAAAIEYECSNNTLPLSITGSFKQNLINIDASFSSQMLTGLLIASPLAEHDTEIFVNGAVSKPYIDMTLEIISHFGVKIEVEDHKKFVIRGGQKYTATTYEIEGDWSSTSNFLVAAAMSGEIIVEGLEPYSKQADRTITEELKMFGAEVSFTKNGVLVRKNECHSFNVDVTDCPDLFPILAILAAAANGKSVIEGIGRLEYKESNRVKAVSEMMRALGGNISLSGNCIEIYGHGKLKGGTVDSFHDHRIAMAAAVAACICEAPVSIINPESVVKSFPDFFEKLNCLY